jgi:DNA-directed RNA polymerase III subunit RPC8
VILRFSPSTVTKTEPLELPVNSTVTCFSGSSHTDVVFRFIVFRPEIGSLLTGKIKSCTRDGIYVTLGFFDDIFIPKDELQHPSRFEEAEQAWVWEYPVEDGEQDKHDLFMDVGETIKFRIIDEEFVESEPTGPPETSGENIAPSTQSADHNARPPYRIIGAINESGLGVESWWTQNEAVEDEEEEEDS